MPLQLPNLPNFNTNIPQADPLQSYGKLLQLKQLQGQQAMLPLQMQSEQQKIQTQGLENQQKQLDLQSQQAMMKAWSDPDFLKQFTGTDRAQASGLGFDPDALSSSLISKGVLPKDAMAMTAQFVERSQKIATTQKDIAQTGEAQASQRQKGMQTLGERIANILDAPAGKAGDLLTQLKQDLVKKSQAFAGVPQEDLAHVYGADLEHLPSMATLLGFDKQIADFHKSKAEATTAEQKVIPEGGGLSPESRQKVATDVAVATNPQIQQGKVAVAAAEGAAKAAQEAKTARGSNAALAEVPPHLVGPASAAANKAGEDYALAQSVTQRLNATMDAAKKGNVISYQVIPEEGTLQITTSQGVHRINQAEIAQYAGGGSLWQRMQGHFGKALSGQSIPKSVLDDMGEIQKIQSQGSQLKYNNSLKTINQTYGADFKPVEMEDIKSVQGGDPFAKFGGKTR